VCSITSPSQSFVLNCNLLFFGGCLTYGREVGGRLVTSAHFILSSPKEASARCVMYWSRERYYLN